MIGSDYQASEISDSPRFVPLSSSNGHLTPRSQIRLLNHIEYAP